MDAGLDGQAGRGWTFVDLGQVKHLLAEATKCIGYPLLAQSHYRSLVKGCTNVSVAELSLQGLQMMCTDFCFMSGELSNLV